MRHFLYLLFILSSSFNGFSQCEDFVVDTIVYHPTCHGFSDGSITINVSGGTDPIAVNIKDSLGNILNAEGTGLANLLVGGQWYYIFVSDGDGCVYEDSIYLIDPLPIEVVFEIIPPSAPDICDGDVLIDTIYNLCNDEGYSCFWSPDPDSDDCDLIDVCPGNYIVTINDACGCSNIAEAFLPGSLANLDDNLFNDIELSYTANGRAILSRTFNETISVEWYSISGALLEMQKVETGQQFVSTPQGKGIYLYRILMNDQLVIGRGKLTCF